MKSMRKGSKRAPYDHIHIRLSRWESPRAHCSQTEFLPRSRTHCHHVVPLISQQTSCPTNLPRHHKHMWTRCSISLQIYKEWSDISINIDTCVILNEIWHSALRVCVNTHGQSSHGQPRSCIWHIAGQALHFIVFESVALSWSSITCSILLSSNLTLETISFQMPVTYSPSTSCSNFLPWCTVLEDS